MIQNKLSSKWKWPLIFVGTAIVIIFLLTATKPEPIKADVEETAWKVSVESISFSNQSPEIELLGAVQSPFESELSTAISADVKSVPAREGNKVQQGDTLIILDHRDINLLIAQLKADISDIKAQIISEENRYQADIEALKQERELMDIAKKSVQRQAKLQQSNLVAQEKFDQAISEEARSTLTVNARELAINNHPARLAQLNARLKRAETSLSDAQLDEERATIKAPFNGIITQVNAAPGERVQIGQTLLKLYDHSAMEVRAQIPDRYVTPINQALANGQEIIALAKHYGHTTKLRLSRLSGEANRGAGGIDALFVPADSSTPLILNSTVKLQVTLPSLSMVSSLPVSSLYGTDRVYQVNDGRIHARKISILGRRLSSEDKELLLISSEELKAGDQIITTQLPNAITGLKVEIRER
jgi:multidrug efflux pump subunit AcrA (membrane-fusion protein)